MSSEQQITGVDGIAAALEQAIHEHRLSPGMKLGEDDLAEVYGVSRTIVRAALQSLAHNRLVDLRRNRGAFVAQPSIVEAREVFEARALLEARTARSAAERAGPEDIARLQAHIDAEHAALAAGDTGRALHLSGQFHNEIAEIADQATIAEMVARLIARSSLIIAVYWQRRSALCESHAHHELLGAFAAHDADRAEELMQGHLLDLVTSLDLRSDRSAPASLREALAQGGAA
ncbi:GntR family transcriptional regulator [Oceanicola sp. 22II-s10i]|uniref:GntR family transcriptional regulator n=1 Tax=Oceanicola sp. 22II-s10i TaxID=1317116 RepID=UPI000B52123B|nr:GntR family transcriptional regulator [Oceanicola sp. 22II-s10i]OWU84992.1 GntR family transcriptional regulator [Oceanicola sp. 22II-s10i]